MVRQLWKTPGGDSLEDVMSVKLEQKELLTSESFQYERTSQDYCRSSFSDSFGCTLGSPEPMVSMYKKVMPTSDFPQRNSTSHRLTVLRLLKILIFILFFNKYFTWWHIKSTRQESQNPLPCLSQHAGLREPVLHMVSHLCIQQYPVDYQKLTVVGLLTF